MAHFDCPECPDQHARIAALEAQVAALAGALREIEADQCYACLSFHTTRSVLTADAAHLSALDAARREVCAAAVGIEIPGVDDARTPTQKFDRLRAALDTLAKLENEVKNE